MTKWGYVLHRHCTTCGSARQETVPATLFPLLENYAKTCLRCTRKTEQLRIERVEEEHDAARN